MAHGAVEVGREDFGPFGGIGAGNALSGHRFRAGAVEGTAVNHDVLQRADANTEVLVATDFEVRMVRELDVANVSDLSQGDVVDRPVECGAVVKTLDQASTAHRSPASPFLRRPSLASLFDSTTGLVTSANHLKHARQGRILIGQFGYWFPTPILPSIYSSTRALSMWYKRDRSLASTCGSI
jgi:hypothetical protein